jgi:hypothetical protein
VGEYQLVPYSFKFHLSGHPNEVRDSRDINAAGMSALDFVAKCAAAHRGSPRVDASVSKTSLEIEAVFRDNHTVVIEAAAGQSGVRSRVRQKRTDTVIHVLEEDWTQIPLRNVFFMPPGATVGTILVERVGHAGVLTKLERMLNSTLRAMFSDLRVSISPLMSAEAMRAWAKDAEIKGVVVQRTDPGTGESARKLKNMPFGTILEFRAPKRRTWTWKQWGGMDEATQKSVLTELVPQLPGVRSADRAEEVAADLLAQGWTVSFSVRSGQRERKLQVETKTGITMTFPADQDPAAPGRPSMGAFRAACQAALVDLAADGMSVGSATLCTWPDDPWQDENEWKAVWGVEESVASANSYRPVHEGTA